ncbi:hypothetical protein [Tateyamaria sp. ANG-S1]|uniref:hypothetical protein n=1 Tax=Tateyamaria sp. ANG-S1 TaxID=1577905 RepID=UPI00057F42DC|nr:hypothetical protein [Tateyamaria sp. ANG-S1]KIC44929.1 hypothetical protein RA29_21450 [Tateyamaria sp. ANG-S1]
MTDTTYLRFDVLLTEGLDIEKRTGWETQFIATKPKVDPDSPFRLVLLDKDDDIIAETAPRVQFRHLCQSKHRHEGEQIARVEAYLPVTKGAREMAFVRGDRTLWRAKVAKQAPKIGDIRVEANAETATVSWDSDGDNDLSFQVIAVIDGDRSHVIALDVEDTKVEVDLTALPAGPEGSDAVFTVLATDGVRSSWIASKPVTLAPRPNKIEVMEPAPDTVLAAETATTLSVRIDGWGKRNEEPDTFRAIIDGEPVAVGTSPLVLPALKPGKHSLRIEHMREQAKPIEQTLTVAEPTKAMTAWREAMQI